jgi:hypothetical protein
VRLDKVINSVDGNGTLAQADGNYTLVGAPTAPSSGAFTLTLPLPPMVRIADGNYGVRNGQLGGVSGSYGGAWVDADPNGILNTYQYGVFGSLVNGLYVPKSGGAIRSRRMP